jgi:Transposase domain (DUF772)
MRGPSDPNPISHQGQQKRRYLFSELEQDLLGEHDVEFGAGVSLSDEELVLRWSENVVWQYFSGMDYYEPRLPCDPTQIGRFRRALGGEGLEQLLKATIETAVEIKAIKPAELERVIVDTTAQEKAMAHPVDSRLLEIARHKVVTKLTEPPNAQASA